MKEQNTEVKYLGQFWGALTIFLPAVFLIKPEILVQLRHLVEEDRGFNIMYALLSLVLGLVTVIVHNKWTTKWNVIITVFGWLCIVKAFMVLCFNEVKKKAIPSFEERVFITQILLALVLVFGVWLFYKSSKIPVSK